MSNYIYLRLDTAAPSSGLSLTINGGAAYAASFPVRLSISCGDSDVWQMKIWGLQSGGFVLTESMASWEAFETSRYITLPGGDGCKTVFIKFRDDVLNESEAISAGIILLASIPVVIVTGPEISRISPSGANNLSGFGFSCNQDITAWKVMKVSSVNAPYDSGTNIQIGSSGGSVNMQGEGVVPANTVIDCKISGTDLENAAGADGTYIIKVFARNNAEVWSR